MSALLLLLAAAPVDARFVLEISGVPMAEIHVTVRGDAYTYEATHFLDEGPEKKRVERSLTDGTPEVLALLTPPASGCREVIEERTGAQEKLCVAASNATSASGTLNETAFNATYARGTLSEISIGSAKWKRAAKPVKRTVENPFEKGVPAPGFTLTPTFAGAKWLTPSPEGRGDADDLGRVRCLLLARRVVAQTPGSRVSVGLVLDAGRAFPHAWVTTSAGAFDPSLPPDEHRRYLEVPVEESGEFFLKLFDGALRLR